MATDIPTREFPDYSIWLYGQPDVPAACLLLQDELDLDVNLVLWCLYAGARGTPLDPATFARADAVGADWREKVVRPLRGVRRWLKGRGPETEAIRQGIIAQEIESELHQQRLIAAAVPLVDGKPSSWMGASNLAAYLRWVGVTPSVDATHAVRTLLERAYPKQGA